MTTKPPLRSILGLRPTERFSASKTTAAIGKVLSYLNSAQKFQKTEASLSELMELLPNTTSIGVEVEVENIKAEFPLPGNVVGKVDHSLRNNGKEFTTAPMLPKEACRTLAVLWFLMNHANSGASPSFSWRASCHLHVDVTELTEQQFKQFLVLSVVFERMLFVLSGGQREHSVFCVPISSSCLFSALHSYLQGNTSLAMLISSWQKYTAVNLRRLIVDPQSSTPGLGTLEFRHQAATKHLHIIILWIAVILRIYEFARTTSDADFQNAILNLDTTPTTLTQFLSSVLSSDLLKKFKLSQMESMFSGSIATAKQLLLPRKELKAGAKSSLQIYITKHRKKKEEQLQNESKTRRKVAQKFSAPQFALNAAWEAGMNAGMQIIDDINP